MVWGIGEEEKGGSWYGTFDFWKGGEGNGGYGVKDCLLYKGEEIKVGGCGWVSARERVAKGDPAFEYYPPRRPKLHEPDKRHTKLPKVSTHGAF